MPLRQAYFGLSAPIQSLTRTRVHFHYFGKNYTLSTLGKPSSELIAHLYHFVGFSPRKGARSSTERLTSSDDFSLSVTKKRSKSSSSSSSTSPSLLSARGGRRQVSSKSVCQPRTEKQPVIVRVDDQVSPRRSTSSTPVKVPTPDTEPLSDRSPLKTSRRLFSSSSSESDRATGRGHKSVESRAGQSLLSSPTVSDSFFASSQEPQTFLWESETIPVKVIYNRAGRLFEEHLKRQHIKPKSQRKTKDLESFVNQAEEELVYERLTFEYYQAKRRPFAHLPLAEKPDWYYHAFSKNFTGRRLKNLLYILNQIRKEKGDSTLDNYVEYYWYLNHKGHSLYLTELANHHNVTYDPSLYRERIIEQDQASAQKYSAAHYAVHPRFTSNLSI